MQKCNRNGLGSVSWLRISDVGADWHSRGGGSCRAVWSATFQMLLLENEKHTSVRDLEYGVGDMEYVWICHKGGVSTNKPLCVQMVTLTRRLLHKIAFVCSPVVEWEQPQTFDQNTVTSSCCLNPLLFPRWSGERTRNYLSSASLSVLFSSGNACAAYTRAPQCRLKNLGV